jgi:hypothetical protein
MYRGERSKRRPSWPEGLDSLAGRQAAFWTRYYDASSPLPQPRPCAHEASKPIESLAILASGQDRIHVI